METQVKDLPEVPVQTEEAVANKPSPEKKRKKKSHIGSDKARLTPFTIVLLVILTLYIVTMVGLLLWALMTTFKDGLLDYQKGNASGFPKKWIFTNYTMVFQKFFVTVSSAKEGVADYEVGIGLMFVYTLLYAIGCAFVGTLIPCIMGYMCARFPYKFSKVIYTIVIITMILPIVGSLPSEINMAKSLGLYDHIWGLWIMKAHFLGMYFLVFYGIFKGVPMAYTEAAKIDGAGNLTIFVRVILPLVKTTFFTVMLIMFINYWNDYQIPEVYLPSFPTIASGMFQMLFNNMGGKVFNRATMRMTGTVVMLLPILTVFLIFQKRLLGNLTVGGIKG